MLGMRGEKGENFGYPEVQYTPTYKYISAKLRISLISAIYCTLYKERMDGQNQLPVYTTHEQASRSRCENSGQEQE